MLSRSGSWLFWESGLFLEEPQLSLDGRLLLYSRRERTADLRLMELARDENK